MSIGSQTFEFWRLKGIPRSARSLSTIYPQTMLILDDVQPIYPGERRSERGQERPPIGQAALGSVPKEERIKEVCLHPIDPMILAGSRRHTQTTLLKSHPSPPDTTSYPLERQPPLTSVRRRLLYVDVPIISSPDRLGPSCPRQSSCEEERACGTSHHLEAEHHGYQDRSHYTYFGSSYQC